MTLLILARSFLIFKKQEKKIKNLVQNSLIMVALVLCLIMGFFINIMFAGFVLAIFMYLIYKLTKKTYLAYLFILIPLIVFNSYSYYYLVMKSPEQMVSYYPLVGFVDNNILIYEVKDNNITKIERLENESLVMECKAINCNYITVDEKTVNTPEWVKNNYSKFSLIDIIYNYNNSNIITVSKVIDITNNYTK